MITHFETLIETIGKGYNAKKFIDSVDEPDEQEMELNQVECLADMLARPRTPITLEVA